MLYLCTQITTKYEMSEQKQIEELKKLMPGKRGKRSYAEKLGVSVEEIERLIKKVKYELEDIEEGLEIEGETRKYNLDKGTLEVSAVYSFAPDPQTVARDHRIDDKEYQLSAYYSKGHKNGTYTVTALFRKVSKEQIVVSSFQDFLKDYKSNYKPLKDSEVFKNNSFSTPVMCEISLADAHIEKFGLEGDSLEDHCEKYLSILDRLIYKAYMSNNIEEIVFVAGNDYFNSDNWQNGTTLHINIQDNNSHWDKTYEVGFDTLVKAITKLRNFSPKVKVIMVPGNHAKTKEFYLGHALEVYFKPDLGVIFDRTSAPRKVHVYHNTAIMYHHGNCKIDQLPLIMASEFPGQWGSTKFHRVHTGDKHFYMEKEIAGVRIKQYPSISQTDRWHNENNYVLNGRVGLLNVFDREKGRITEYEEMI